MTSESWTPEALSAEQAAIVEWDEGPLVVVAGAGTGKTRVIVERVRRLLERHAMPAAGSPANAADIARNEPFGGPLLPEQVLVLTYNVKAAKELGERLEKTLGPAVRARLGISNFHSFCNTVLGESAPDAGLPGTPDVLDGVGQVLLLRDIRPNLPLVYYAGSNPNWWLDRFVGFINRAKDELVGPDDFDLFVEAERVAFEARYGPFGLAVERLTAQGMFSRGATDVRQEYARLRAAERAGEDPGDAGIGKAADREARRAVLGTGGVVGRNRLTPDQLDTVDRLAATYVVDGAALEVLRLSELALVYRAYQAELARRGALDFGEQIAAVIRLFRRRPNVLRRWQRHVRYLLVDEFQDANVAQIELIEMLGRTPDRPANVMVVGDDDQSIYRFRGASYAAFVEFDRRFGGPPAHDPGAPPPGLPTRLRLEENYRSQPAVLTVANRLIARNELRYEPGKHLAAHRGGEAAVELVTCTGPDDEAAAIVERIAALAAWDPSRGGAPALPWTDFAVLYRKHKHREAIVARLREAGIPYTVSGGISLFEAPEIRDLEQALRALVDPFADVALARTLTAGPWRLDALELLAVTRAAKRAGRPIFELVRDAAGTGAVTLEDGEAGRTGHDGDGDDGSDRHADVPEGNAATGRVLVLGSAARAKLRRLLATFDELVPAAPREGPFTILERYLERTGTLLDLLGADTLEAKRAVANIASLLRFAADWQREHPARSLAGFVEYLDAYQDAGGDLPTSVELAEDVAGVRLMTLYQAKGLEYRYVFVPCLLDGEWPVREQGFGLFPRELLREAVPAGDLHTEEERRLLYVAITRARDGLTLLTRGGPTVERAASAFVGELVDGAGSELVRTDRVGGPAAEGSGDDGGDLDSDAAALERIVDLPSPRERRAALRQRAVELLSMLEGIAPDAAEAGAARAAFLAELGRVGDAAIAGADAARAAGLDPLTLRTVALDAGTGANLLSVAPLPGHFSYSQFRLYEECPLRYAFSHVYRFPPPADAAGYFTFGSAAHAAFEAFTRDRRERAARGDPPPTREDLARAFAAEWKPEALPDRTTAETYGRRVGRLLDNFWDGELASAGEALHEELGFELVLDARGDGGPSAGGTPVRVTGSIDRIDRLPSGGIEVIDYKTGKITSQKGVDESLQLSVYALACRDALGLGTPERVTLYFTESATRLSTARTDGQLDAARDELLARAAVIRSGDFHATPSPQACGRCDFAALCPARVR